MSLLSLLQKSGPCVHHEIGKVLCKVLGFYLIDVCLSILSMISSDKILSLNIIRIERLIVAYDVM